MRTEFEVLGIEQLENQFLLNSENKQTGPYDHIIANTGASPDYAFLNMLDIELDEQFLVTKKLSNRVDPKLHSCGTVSYNFKETLLLKLNYFMVGMKSFSKASNFYFQQDTRF